MINDGETGESGKSAHLCEVQIEIGSRNATVYQIRMQVVGYKLTDVDTSNNNLIIYIDPLTQKHLISVIIKLFT